MHDKHVLYATTVPIPTPSLQRLLQKEEIESSKNTRENVSENSRMLLYILLYRYNIIYIYIYRNNTKLQENSGFMKHMMHNIRYA